MSDSPTPSDNPLARMFLTALRTTANVTRAAELAGIHRDTAYEWRKDEAFAVAWAEALERGLDALEDEGMRRASEGTRKHVISMGKIVRGLDGEPLMEHTHSDTLLMFFLKARRPGYRDRSTVDLNVGDLAELIAAGRKKARGEE